MAHCAMYPCKLSLQKKCGDVGNNDSQVYPNDYVQSMGQSYPVNTLYNVCVLLCIILTSTTDKAVACIQL